MIHDSRSHRARLLGPATCLVLALAFAAVGRAGEVPGPPRLDDAARAWLDSDGSAAFGAWLADQVAAQPDPPEWLVMYADILKGSRLGPGEGWFRVAVARSRYGWDRLRARYDADGDGRIAGPEFPGPAADFARLDRDRDGAVTEPDLTWPAHALEPSPGAMVFQLTDADGDGHVTPREFAALFEPTDPDAGPSPAALILKPADADADGDGRVAPEESEALFRRIDRDGLGFLALDDLKEGLATTTPPPDAFGPPQARPRSGGPSKATLVEGLFRQEIGSLQPGPAVDEPAPDFRLPTVAGDQTITLSERIGPKPVVLVFGNITCGPFRSQAGNIEKLYRRYRDRADFLMVYVREAHPTDGWVTPSNDRYGVALAQPRTDGERTQVAQACQQKLGFNMPFLVDSIDDRVGVEYSGMPGRFYVIDRAGKVAYQSGRGPFGFKTGELEQALLWTLADPAAGPTAPPVAAP